MIGAGRLYPLTILAAALVLTGCSSVEVRQMEVTAYCGCGECCGYERGRWLFLKLNFWNRYINYGPRKGQHYTGRTASGAKPRTPRPGLLSRDSLHRPWMIPVRIALPWLAFPRKGTIAADTRYYPFGTVMYVPGWGWGVVQDRGGAIKGPDRLDLFFRFHRQTIRWGRRHLDVKIIRPD
jgi:hypothetical protein